MLAQLLANQSRLMETLLDVERNPNVGKKNLTSTIKIAPKVSWPELGDRRDGSGKEAEEFLEKFEDICHLANDGFGMKSREMLIAMGNCLKGSRKLIYDNIIKEAKKRICSLNEVRKWFTKG